MESPIYDQWSLTTLPLPKMVRILGVVLAASSVRAKVTYISIQVFFLFLLPMFYILLSISFLLIFASYFLLPGVSPSAVLALPLEGAPTFGGISNLLFQNSITYSLVNQLSESKMSAFRRRQRLDLWRRRPL